MADNMRDQERNELHRTIWALANDLRGSVDGWDFKQYVLGMLFYRYISENFADYLNKGEHEAGNTDFNYAKLSDKQAEVARTDMLVAKYHASNCEDKEVLADINKSIDASVELRSKKVLIEGFIAQMTVKTDVDKDWKEFVKKQKEADLEALIAEEKLKPEETKKFVANSFRDGDVKTTGTDLDKILPPISRFSGGASRTDKKQTVIEKLKRFFEKYFGLV